MNPPPSYRSPSNPTHRISSLRGTLMSLCVQLRSNGTDVSRYIARRESLIDEGNYQKLEELTHEMRRVLQAG